MEKVDQIQKSMLVWFETKHEEPSFESKTSHDHEELGMYTNLEEKENILKGLFDNPQFPENPVSTQC